MQQIYTLDKSREVGGARNPWNMISTKWYESGALRRRQVQSRAFGAIPYGRVPSFLPSFLQRSGSPWPMALLVLCWSIRGAVAASFHSEDVAWTWKNHGKVDAESAFMYRHQSKYQLIEVKHGLRTNMKTLFLDGVLQLTDDGEASYHEMMAHVPLQTLRDPPSSVLVIGGGDGGVTLRVLQHPSVKSVSHVELDDAVVNTSKRFFPKLAKAFDDPRVKLYVANAIDWVKEEAAKKPGTFDACIIDFTDDPLVQRFNPTFFAAVKQLLKPKGVLMQNIHDGTPSNKALFDHMIQLHYKGGFRSVLPVLLTTVDYGSPYVVFLSSPNEAHCAGPALEAKAREEPLAAEWYSSSTHVAAVQYFPWMLKVWPQLGTHAASCMVSVPPRQHSMMRKELAGSSHSAVEVTAHGGQSNPDDSAGVAAVKRNDSPSDNEENDEDDEDDEDEDKDDNNNYPCAVFFKPADKDQLTTVSGAQGVFRKYCKEYGHGQNLCKMVAADLFASQAESSAIFWPDPIFCATLVDTMKLDADEFHAAQQTQSHVSLQEASNGQYFQVKYMMANRLANTRATKRAEVDKTLNGKGTGNGGTDEGSQSIKITGNGGTGGKR